MFFHRHTTIFCLKCCCPVLLRTFLKLTVVIHNCNLLRNVHSRHAVKRGTDVDVEVFLFLETDIVEYGNVQTLLSDVQTAIKVQVLRHIQEVTVNWM